jgi:hypothetical protein
VRGGFVEREIIARRGDVDHLTRYAPLVHVASRATPFFKCKSIWAPALKLNAGFLFCG